MQSAHARPLRIALLGVDASTAAIARAIVASQRFELIGAWDVDGTLDPDLARAIPPSLVRRAEPAEWEALLDREFVDAVIVARSVDQDRRAEQLRKLIQVEVPLVAAHPVVDSMLVYYELDMIRRETGSVTVPHLPARNHPALTALSELANQGPASPIGKSEQVVFERRIASAEKDDIVQQFARDVDLLRAIAGDMTRLGAMAGSRDRTSYAGLGVQMSGPSGVVARWSVDPIVGPPAGTVSLLGTRGKAVVRMHADERPWSLELTVAGQTSTRDFADWNPAVATLGELELALSGEAPVPGWVDAARSIELAETVDRSLLKERTIELYYEDYTEEGTFKGTMTSIGCGLLMMALALLGVVAIADQMGVPYVRGWPYALVAVLGIFLLSQLLMLVFRQDDTRRDDAASVEGSPPG